VLEKVTTDSSLAAPFRRTKANPRAICGECTVNIRDSGALPKPPAKLKFWRGFRDSFQGCSIKELSGIFQLACAQAVGQPLCGKVLEFRHSPVSYCSL
jgi:hypothetical protein